MKKPAVIFENDVVLVLNKPAGLMVHGDGRSDEATLADWIVENYPTIASVGEPWINPKGLTIYRPGIVHRLDRDTSGVLIVAKTQESFESLKQQFQGRQIEKTYEALVYGNIKEEEGHIDKPIAKSKKDFRVWSAQPGARGKARDAVTDFRVLGRNADRSLCHVEVYPKTGRTHQIRVHFKAIHHPLVCDPLYATGRACELGMNRVALHAKRINVDVPGEGRREFEAPLPDDFAQAIRVFKVG